MLFVLNLSDKDEINISAKSFATKLIFMKIFVAQVLSLLVRVLHNVELQQSNK